MTEPKKRTNEITSSEKPSGASPPSAPKADVDFLKWLMVGVVLVMGIAIGGLLTNELAQKQSSYESLKNRVSDQNTKIEILTKEIENLNETVRSSNE